MRCQMQQQQRTFYGPLAVQENSCVVDGNVAVLSTVTSPWHVSSMVSSPRQSNFSCERQSRRKGSRSGKKGGGKEVKLTQSCADSDIKETLESGGERREGGIVM